MRLWISAAILLLAPLSARGTVDPVKAELEKLEGTWSQVKAFRADGEPVPEALAAGFRVRFAGETMTNISSPAKPATFRITLDPSQSPRRIFMQMSREGAPPRPGIYRVDGDQLEIAWGGAGPRGIPTSLGPCPKDSKARWTYDVFRRVTGPDVLTPEQAARAAEESLEKRRALAVGTSAPEIVGTDLEGRPLKLSDYRGRVVVLSFWGSWCVPCLAEIPRERALAERLKGRPFALLGVDCNDEVPAALGVVRRERMSWPSWHDGVEAGGPIASSYHVTGFPSLFVLDGRGIIRATNVFGEKLDQTIDALLEEAGPPK